MDELQTAVRVAEFLSVPVGVAAFVLVLIGRLLPIGLPSRVWIWAYLIVLGLGWLALVACWLSFFGIEPDNHTRSEAFLVCAFVSCMLVPITAAAIAGSV